MLTETARKIYSPLNYEKQEKRQQSLTESFKAAFGNEPQMLFSAPGRSEICGNHTDHNMGKAVGAAIDLDILAAVSPTENGIIHIFSEGFPEIIVDTENCEYNKDEEGTSVALVKGIVTYMKNNGRKVGGFDAFSVSDVGRGSGLSSSAAYEVLIVGILNELYNENEMSPMETALCAHSAENKFFGKACGTLDQLSCSFGGMIAIDFENPLKPVCSPIDFSFEKTGYSMVITDVHSDHADLTADYVAIKSEMQAVANHFGKDYLRQVNFEDFKDSLPALKKKVSERALLRAFHYFNENNRVDALYNTLNKNNFDDFLDIVNDSGRSSYMYLQNIYSQNAPENQAMSLALYLAQSVLLGRGAWRVHGGGFGGTIQAYVPNDFVESYCEEMNAVFGENSSVVLQIRPLGPVRIK